MKIAIAKPTNLAEPTIPSARWALVSLSLMTLLSSLGTSIANVGLPTLANEFNVAFQDVQWVVIAYLLAITTLIVSVGRLGDVLGRRPMLLAGLILFMFASAICGVVQEFWQLIAARFAQGLGAANMMALTMAFVGEIVPKEKIGRAMGLLGTMSAVGTALGPSLGGVLIASLGWHSIFLINLPVGGVALFLAYRYLPVDPVNCSINRSRADFPRVDHSRFDYRGTVLLAATLAVYALAVTIGQGHFGIANLLLAVAAVAGLGLFVLVESRAKSPLIRLVFFRNPILSAGFATSSLVATVIMATLVVGPFYLSGALGLDAARVGLVMSSGPLVSALVGVPGGKLVDRFGSDRITILGLSGTVMGAGLLTMMPISLGVVGYIVPLVVLTAGYALFQVANNTSVMAKIPSDQRGLIAGMLNLSRNLGLITGASVMGTIFALGSGAANLSHANPEAMVAGMRVVFGVAVFLIALAIAIVFKGQIAARKAGVK